MRKMKDSGIAWIGEIPEGYSLSRLKYFIKFINGYAFDSNEFSTGSGIPVIRIGDIAAKIDFNQCVKVEPNIKYNSFLVKKHDILLAMSGATFGKTALLHDKMQAYINQRVGIIRSNANNYFYYLFNIAGFFEYLRYTFMGSAQPNISGEDIKNYTFLNLPNKKQIADYLDQKCAEIDKLIELQESMIEKLKEYKQSVITHAVTKGLDPDVPMKDSGIEWIGKIPMGWGCCRIKDVAYFNPISKIDQGVQIVSYAPMECVKDGWLIHNEININNASTGLTLFQENDIVMAKVTPCFENGNIAIATELKNGIAYGSSELFVFRTKNIDNKWLFYFLRNCIFKKRAIATMTGTGGLKRVSPKFVSEYHLAVPPFDEQHQIADYLDKKCAEIDNLIELKEQKIEKLKEYKKSLIYEYVTGKKEVC